MAFVLSSMVLEARICTLVNILGYMNGSLQMCVSENGRAEILSVSVPCWLQVDLTVTD